MNDAGNVAIGNEADSGAGFASSRDEPGMARSVEDKDGYCGGIHAFRPSYRGDVLFDRRVKVHDPFGIAGADCDLFHVYVGSMQERSALGNCDHSNRPRQILGAQRGPFERIDRDVEIRPDASSDLFADEEHRRFVPLAFADHNRALDREFCQFMPHGIHCSPIGVDLVAKPTQEGRRNSRALGHAGDLEAQDALDDEVSCNGY